jgi:hypothetical protein
MFVRAAFRRLYIPGVKTPRMRIFFRRGFRSRILLGDLLFCCEFFLPVLGLPTSFAYVVTGR